MLHGLERILGLERALDRISMIWKGFSICDGFGV